MAAVLPHLEIQHDPSETPAQEKLFSEPGEAIVPVEAMHKLRGLGELGERDVAMDPVVVTALNQSHAELLSLAWIRKNVEDALTKRTYRVQARDIHGARPKDVFIILDAPIVLPDEFVTPWNPPATPNAQQFGVLSWTSKMGCPSFSLPAGAPSAGGACPGATAGQSIVPTEALHAAARLVKAHTGRNVRAAETICQYCYATGGQYMTSQVQFAQVMRYVWSRRAAADVRIEGGRITFGEHAKHWIRAMTYAIEHADFMLDGGKVGKIVYPEERARRGHTSRKGDSRKYFRWHDSGDFFSAQYFALVKAVCNHFPDITFWAPSRIWATSWGPRAVNEINGPAEQSNLVIRPSAYHINEAPPSRDQLGQGWANGSAAFHKDVKAQGAREGAFDFDCQTYAVDDESHTCRHAVAPDGKVGCRACWVRRDLITNYTLH
jgi:hypothetical protein